MKFQLNLLLLLFTLLLTATLHAQTDADPSQVDTIRITPPAAPDQPQQKSIADIQLAPVVQRLIDDPLTSEPERRRLKCFHHQFDDLDNPTTAEQAYMALVRYDLKHPALQDPQTPVLLRARAAWQLSQYQEAIDLLAGQTSIQAAVLRAQCFDLLNQPQQALEQLLPVSDALTRNSPDDPAELTAAARALTSLARLQGRPSQDYHRAMQLLARVRTEIDPLYWPAPLLEAQLLFAKDNRKDAAKAITETLELNPAAPEAWFLLGQHSLESYNFNNTQIAINKLAAFSANHPLAAALLFDMRLKQRDLASAQDALDIAIHHHPKNHTLQIRRQTLEIAQAALAVDPDALTQALLVLQNASPDPAEAFLLAGRFLADTRQYQQATIVLQAAINRRPNWPAPHIELGLLLMQSGHETAAASRLQVAARLDPFNLRAHNQLTLARQLLTYEIIETENFVIKYSDPIDEVLARDIALRVEQMRRETVTWYRYQPPNKTVIEIMPDTEHFAVRITGMPDLWTFAACTGDVIAMAPPRIGPKQQGPYNWPRVLRHEFDHVMTLNQTSFRIPHWFTEALAVYHEPGIVNYKNCQMLARKLHRGELFDLEEISWAFIRPKKKGDRALAYAQSAWMVQYINETHGRESVLALLELFQQNTPNTTAVQSVTRQPPDQFMADFLAWAKRQTLDWGLTPPPADPRFQSLAAIAHTGNPRFDFDLLDELLADYPDQPDLLRMAAQIAIDTDNPRTARQAVLRYAAARPVDPWSSQMLAKLALQADTPALAVGPLEHLDAQSDYTASWSVKLTDINRDLNELNTAATWAERALEIEPYNANYRELAATLQLQTGNLEQAAHHIHALTVLEPDRSLHYLRYAAILKKLDRHDESRAAALRARELDADAPIDKFLD